ncbi:MAG TPA: YihY/virulence factor BrkB family protein [Xanthobacteraceae bacterium]|jgi:membrane protein
MQQRRTGGMDAMMIAAATALTMFATRYYLHESRRRGLVEPTAPIRAAAHQKAIEIERTQPGRGRSAANPFHIPWKGWRDILGRTYQQIGEDRLLAIAAGVVFFGLLAVFPAITALVSCYGLFADPKTISDNLQSLAVMLPGDSYHIVQDQIARVLAKGNTALGFAFLFGLALSLWSANAGVKAIMDALNVVYGETEKRGFIKLNAVSLAFTVGGIAALLVMIGAVVALPLVLNHVWIRDDLQILLNLARWPLLLAILLLALGILYRYGPSRVEARWQWLSVGAFAAALLWLVGSFALSWYLSNFGNYSATYGSLGAAIGLMMWLWMSSIIVLCGAELNSEIEHQTAIDTTVGATKPMGARGARMADTVGHAVG